MRAGQTALILLLAAVGGVLAPGCGSPQPYVRYDGDQERLRQLEALKKEELITPEEYQKKRAEILEEI